MMADRPIRWAAGGISDRSRATSTANLAPGITTCDASGKLDVGPAAAIDVRRNLDREVAPPGAMGSEPIGRPLAGWREVELEIGLRPIGAKEQFEAGRLPEIVGPFSPEARRDHQLFAAGDHIGD
jgi:hypothetical protein